MATSLTEEEVVSLLTSVQDRAGSQKEVFFRLLVECVCVCVSAAEAGSSWQVCSLAGSVAEPRVHQGVDHESEAIFGHTQATLGSTKSSGRQRELRSVGVSERLR